MSREFQFPSLAEQAQRYDISQSYDWNYDNAPDWPTSFSSGSGGWQLCGVDVASPIGIAAGPLLNGRWILHYAAAGFDVLTYKTVRSRAWPCYELPNLQPIESVELDSSPSQPLNVTAAMTGSWAVSFGMPSKDPEVWRRDVEETRRRLPAEKKLSVSVVATPQDSWTIDEVANDYAQCAAWAVESGAEFVELNFSCPNVSTCDGQLYQNADSSGIVADRVRSRISQTPLLIKIGQVLEPSLADSLVQRLSSSANALVMINCIGAMVEQDRLPLFSGNRRGIAGPAIRAAVLRQLSLFSEVIKREASSLELVAVGGQSSHADVQACLEAGAAATQLATAAMWQWLT